MAEAVVDEEAIVEVEPRRLLRPARPARVVVTEVEIRVAVSRHVAGGDRAEPRRDRLEGLAVGVERAADAAVEVVVRVFYYLRGRPAGGGAVGDFDEAVAIVPLVFGDVRVAGGELAVGVVVDESATQVTSTA